MTTTNAQRSELVKIANVLIAHKLQIQWGEVRPMRTAAIRSVAQLEQLLGRGDRLTMDCSESITLMFRLAGLKDPNGLGYDGEGYTGTLLGHLKHYSEPGNGHPGALVVFGGGTGKHVCMVLERHGSDPLLFSHGHNGSDSSNDDPRTISFTAMRSYFAGDPFTMLDISELG